jgi:hypothetical protein
MRSLLIPAALVVVLSTGSTAAQKATPADLAAALSGSWKLNEELSPSLGSSGRTGGRGEGRGGGALFAMAAAPAGQRGGRGGGRGGGEGGGSEASSEVMREEAAAQSALRILQQVPLVITIVATATDVKFTDPRGEWAFRVDDKTTAMDVPGGQIKVKSKWDKQTLRQDFSTVQRKLVKTWSIDGNNRLVMTERVESMTLNTTESRAVFDRQ